MRNIALAMVSASLLLGLWGNSAFSAERCKIAWSHYTGWEPVGFIQGSGIAAKWGERHGVDLSFVLINDYIESINQYTAGSFDGVTSTNMDALTIPAVGGVDTTVLVIGDFSNGNDGVLIRSNGVASMTDLAGKNVQLVELSVSHYLLARALEMNGMSERDLTVVNTSDADIGGLIASAPEGSAFVTWNPILLTGAKQPGVKLVFDSADIPGEIIDSIVVRTDASDACKKAVVGAWYEAMGIMSAEGPVADKAIAFMAEQAGGTVQDLADQLKTTRMFYQADEAAGFAASAELKKTMDHVRQFSFRHGLFGQGAQSPDFVGISFPDGSVLGNSENVTLRFDNAYMKMAAEGGL